MRWYCIGAVERVSDCWYMWVALARVNKQFLSFVEALSVSYSVMSRESLSKTTMVLQAKSMIIDKFNDRRTIDTGKNVKFSKDLTLNLCKIGRCLPTLRRFYGIRLR